MRGPSPLPSLPPSPEAPAHPPLRPQKDGAGGAPHLPGSKFQRPARGWHRPRQPGSPPARAARAPRPRPAALPSPQAGRRRRASGSPTPRAARRPAQGAGFLEAIRRKSAGPPASRSPPDPAGARSAAAPPAAPAGGGGRALGAPLPPGVGGGSEEEGPGPGGRPPDKHLSPPPGRGHVLHILGRLGAGGGVSSGDRWGTDGEPHPVYPLSSSAPKQALWGGWQRPPGPAGRRRSPLPSKPACCRFPPWGAEAEGSCHQRTSPHTTAGCCPP